jgi:hypothetical protein
MSVLALTTSFRHPHLFLLLGLISVTWLLSINNKTRVLCFKLLEPRAVNFRRRLRLPEGRLIVKNNDDADIIGYSANQQFTHSRIATTKSTTTCIAAFTSSSHIGGSGGTSLDRLDATSNSTTTNSSSNTILWDIYICESKQCKDRGGAETFGAFVGLAPPHIVAM